MQFGVKKSQVTKALDALAEADKITCKVRLVDPQLQLSSRRLHTAQVVLHFCRAWQQSRHAAAVDLQEFGKTKIYMPLQDAGPSLSKEVRLATFPAW